MEKSIQFRTGLTLFFLGLFVFSPQLSKAIPTFEEESSILITSGTPQVIIGTYPSVTMYFIRDAKVWTATSTDGKTWGVNLTTRVSTGTTPSLTFSSITACSILPLDAGGFRMLYSTIIGTDTYRIFSATSSDGLNWANDAGTRYEAGSGLTFVGSPRLHETTAGVWQMFFTQDVDGGNDIADRQVYLAESSDEGLTWTSSTTVQNVFSSQVGEIGISSRTGGRFRLVYTAPLTGETTNSTILSQLSNTSAGTSFSSETGTRISTTSASTFISNPILFRSTEPYRWRMYYALGSHTSTTTHIYNALTTQPDAVSISPSSVDRADPATVYSITGEIFSPGVTARLTKSGETDISGTNSSRSNDQNISFTFDTQSQALGGWDLVVTNSDGEASTISDAVTISFSPGIVSLTDNLIRPRNSQQTSITVTIFENGQVSMLIYTVDGKLIRTVSNQFRNSGTFSENWDGRTDDGNMVASGVYILNTRGPKLDSIKKIVVIK